MKSLRFLLFLFALPLLNFAQIRVPLSNQRVILLVESGVRRSEVVRLIGTAAAVSFDLTPSGTDRLLRAGVSEETIKRMSARELALPYPTNDTRSEPDNLVRVRNVSFHPDSDSGFAAQVRREALIVQENTPVFLRLTRNVSSAHARMDNIIHFEVIKDVTVRNRVGNFLVIKRGETAWGTVTEASQKKTLGRAGKVEVTIDSVGLANGDKIALSAVTQADRHRHVGRMVGLMVPTAIVYFPAAPFWLFSHGEDSTIKAGFDITAYPDGVANLDSLDFDTR